jgi:hypothetical protein
LLISRSIDVINNYDKNDILSSWENKKPVAFRAAGRNLTPEGVKPGSGLLLPRTLLVAVSLQALTALVLVHLKTTFLFQVAHGVLQKFRFERCSGPAFRPWLSS